MHFGFAAYSCVLVRVARLFSSKQDTRTERCQDKRSSGVTLETSLTERGVSLGWRAERRSRVRDIWVTKKQTYIRERRGAISPLTSEVDHSRAYVVIKGWTS